MASKQTVEPKRIHRLTVSGGKSYSLVLPVEFVRYLNWKERQELIITLEGTKLIIEDSKT